MSSTPALIDVRVLDHMTNGTTLLIADKAVAWRPLSGTNEDPPGGSPTPTRTTPSLSYLKDELNAAPGGLRHRRRSDPFREHRDRGLVPG